MRLFRLLGAATFFSVLAMPAMAQAVIYEPGYCAQYYPDANCQNMGPGNPDSPEYRSRLGQTCRRGPAVRPSASLENDRGYIAPSRLQCARSDDQRPCLRM